MDTSYFKNNSAYLYANDVGSFPQRVIAINQSVYDDQMTLIKNNLRQLEAKQSDVISDQRSGGEMPPYYFALADQYNNIVGNQNSG